MTTPWWVRSLSETGPAGWRSPATERASTSPTCFSNTLSVIQTSDNTVVGSIPTGSGPGLVAVTPSGDYLYVTNYSGNTVSVIPI